MQPQIFWPVLSLLALCTFTSITHTWAADTSLNLALGKTCKVFSSHEADGWSVAKLTDGDSQALGWSSKAFSAHSIHSLYPEFIVLDLGTNCVLDRVELYPRADASYAGRGFPADFTIQVCTEGEPWRVLVERKGYAIPSDAKPQVFELGGAEGRYVKVEATRLREVLPGKHHFQLAEISVTGEPVQTPPLREEATIDSKSTMVARLRCENRENPVGIDVERPRFSWWLESQRRGQCQTGYRILVASRLESLRNEQGDLWDSGKVGSDQSIAVFYGGRPLRSGQDCWWKVQLWDRDGTVTAWSAPAKFVTGKLRAEDWAGEWIGADQELLPISPAEISKPGASIHLTANPGRRPVYLRKEINVGKPVRRAMVFFSGLGFSELRIDGRKIGDYVVGPGFTTYDKTVPYLVYDVTGHFSQPGSKAISAILVDGWYGNGFGHGFEKNSYVDKPKLRFDLRLEHPDGSETLVISDSSWKWSDGEITCSGIVQEDIDHRRIRPGWDLPAYDDHKWRQAVGVKGPEGRLVRQREEPSRVVGELSPVNVRYEAGTKTATFDFDREFCGWVRFRTAGAAGTTISITTLPTVNLPRTSHFTLAGTGGDEVYEPRFFYAGMRQVVVKGITRPPKLEDLTGCIVSMSWKPAGMFRCSDDVANWLYDTTRRTVVAYTTWLPNDPVREWKAWMQDPQNMFWSTAYLFDAQTMYERWQRDIVDGQRPDGSSPNIAPGAYFDDYNSPWWGGCLVWVPWNWYQYYGDSSLLKDSYPAMKRYLAFLGRIAREGLQDWGLADWLCVEETPRPIVNTPAHYLFASILQQTAEMLGEKEEARQFAETAEGIRAAFNNRFLDSISGIYGPVGSVPQVGGPVAPPDGKVPHEVWWTGDRPCTQAGQVLPLALGMVPEASRQAVKRALLKEIAAHRNRLSTGFVSTPYLLAFLSEEAPEVGWMMTSAQDYPSWWGMTAGSDQDLLKETWAGGQALMPSLGGNLVAWYEQALAGIRPDPAGPGFKKVIIKPYVPEEVHWVESHYDSVHGRIATRWRKRGQEFSLEVRIPPSVTATVTVPSRDPSTVTESGKPISQGEGVTALGEDAGKATYAVTSGVYHFRSQLPP